MSSPDQSLLLKSEVPTLPRTIAATAADRASRSCTLSYRLHRPAGSGIPASAPANLQGAVFRLLRRPNSTKLTNTAIRVGDSTRIGRPGRLALVDTATAGMGSKYTFREPLLHIAYIGPGHTLQSVLRDCTLDLNVMNKPRPAHVHLKTLKR